MPATRSARLRAELILKVRTGQMTATAAAAALGVSRKTYYEWEVRGLRGMLRALHSKVAQLQKRLASMTQTAELRALLRSMEAAPAKKKGSRSSRSSP
jgi:transposase